MLQLSSDVAGSNHCANCGQAYDASIKVCPNDGTNFVELRKVEGLLANRYEILGAIGNGGMGAVYKGRQQALDRMVAIKIMKAQDREQAARFRQEAQLASMLDHPNIIRIYDFGTAQNDQPFMVMDFVNGVDLGELIKTERGLLVSESLHIFSEVCAGMAHAHAKGVVHRDLKPSNIMLADLECLRPTVKIVDFGIAKSIDPAQKSQVQTATSDLFGSPYYMSPEQALGKPLDARSDIYSLGCIMYETLTGTLPIAGANPFITLKMHVTEKPMSLRERCPLKNFSPEVERLVMRALAKEPHRRFQSMDDVREAIEALPEMRSDLTTRSGSSLTPLKITQVNAPYAGKRRRMPLPVVVPLSLAFLVATGLGAGAFFSQLNHHKDPSMSGARVNEPSLDEALNRLRKTAGDEKTGTKSGVVADDQDPDRQMTANNKDMLDVTQQVSNGKGIYHDTLYLRKQRDPDEAFVKQLHDKPNVTRVILELSTFETDPLALLKNSKVQTLQLTECKFPHEALNSLKDIPQLKVLKVVAHRGRGYSMSDDDVSKLKGLKTVKVLELGGQTRLTAKSLDCLPPNVEELLLINDKKIEADRFEQLSKYPHLKKLDLSGTTVSDEAIQKIAKLKNLEFLFLDNTKISDSSVETFLKLPLKNIELDETYITRKGLLALAQSKTLERILIPRSTVLTADDFNEFRRQAGNRIHLLPDRPNMPDCQWDKVVD